MPATRDVTKRDAESARKRIEQIERERPVLASDKAWAAARIKAHKRTIAMYRAQQAT